MIDTNYVGAIVKILETPRQKLIKNDIPFVKFRAQLSQLRQTRIINLVFWGNLSQDIVNNYKINDYILIEGYLSIRNELNLKANKPTVKKAEITVLKVYPFLLSHDRFISTG